MGVGFPAPMSLERENMAKFLTLNTHSWMEENQLEKLERLADRIAHQAYDVICLQEVNQLITSHEKKNLKNYQALNDMPAIHEDHFAALLIDYLSDRGHTYYWSWAYNHIGFDRFHEGVAILSRKPLRAKAICVSNVNDPLDYRTRKILLAETKVDGQMMSIASVHLSWWNKGFQEEWNRLEKILEKSPYPLILMGDFNNPVGHEGYKKILASCLSLQDSHQVAENVSGSHTVAGEIAGWQDNQDDLKIDYVFTNKRLYLKSSSVVFNDIDGPIISDHYGLEVVSD